MSAELIYLRPPIYGQEHKYTQKKNSLQLDAICFYIRVILPPE